MKEVSNFYDYQSAELKKRLKYWHIGCMNCGCAIKKIPKEDIIEIEEFISCPDCREEVLLIMNKTLYNLKPIFTKCSIIIKCNFRLK